ncbi:MAG TPA: YncE family protein [Patescibacteria group bacterium]|nr:YncE family protein [Patescibacteria group bacterium]
MRDHLRLLMLAIAVAIAAASAVAAETAPLAYHLAATFKVGGDGGWDYATLKEDGRVIYVTRTTHTMVIDVASGRILADIPGQQRSHGVALVPEAGRGFISDGGNGSVLIFDLKTRKPIGSVPAAADADGIIYDPASNRVLVMCGDAHQIVAIAPDVNPAGGKPAATVDLGGAPEFAVADGKGKVFVNIVDKDEVAVVDTKAMKVIARWPTAPGNRPTGLSMDRATRRLFIGCRNNKLVVMNADDGKIVADFPIGAFVDATAFRDGLVFASCGDGTLTIIEASPDKFEPAQVVKTQLGARTMAVDQTGMMIYLPTADLNFAPGSTPTRPRPIPVPGTFRILEVTQ